MATSTKSRSDIQDLLKDRGNTYGDFMSDAGICQALKDVMHKEARWSELLSDQKQALEMIMVKVARILNGNPDHIDHWVDIAGYSTLVANRLGDEKLLALPAPEGQVSSGELPKLLRNTEDQSI
jgi:hypothetical protein